MVRDGIECLVGVKRDPVFGPLLAVGLGGIHVEILGDLALRRAPVSSGEAMKMIGELRASPILFGARGRAGADAAALADLIVRVSLMALTEPDLEELDCNPVFVRREGEGVVIADALIRRRCAA
jgi:acyl-CoA synthetase (NDP forming)